MKFSTVCVLTMFLSLAAAAPLDVYVPPVLDPHEGTVWTIGNEYNVTWDASSPPPQITNRIGRVLLRKGPLSLNITLASGFDILDGTVPITVPDVEPGDDYAVVLFGDSGNFSPGFTITN